MGKVAIVKNGVARNVTEASNAQWAPPEGSTAVDVPDGLPVARDWTYDGVNFAPPPEPDPAVLAVDMYKVKLELLKRGALASTEAAVLLLTPQAKKDRAVVRWNTAAPVVTGDVISDVVAATLNLNARQLERFFLAAETQ